MDGMWIIHSTPSVTTEDQQLPLFVLVVTSLVDILMYHGTSFPSVPHVFVTAHHNVLDNKHDAATVWVEEITTNDFIVCMREARTFDGRHKDIDVTWMAMNEVPQTWNYHDFIRVDFPNTLVPSEADNNAFCQVVSFHEPYYAPPTIVVAPSHHYDSSNVNAIRPEDNSIAAWVEETTRTQFKTCVKDLVGLKNKHHPIEVDYMVFGGKKDSHIYLFLKSTFKVFQSLMMDALVYALAIPKRFRSYFILNLNGIILAIILRGCPRKNG
ncbi:uncharacterized protein LOC110254042 [Exaiptasia diaphana]|uniref:Uncharacterized protein n=1 Tax=Exaiptasia diaphana TaxID=2652724 RepID=A0A913Y910_EXADI|nr:uncharacterized protein LOC110254042 [Exaiptasia diaphana]